MMADTPSHLVPKLRFPEFHNDGSWGSTMLGQVCRIATGKKDANEGCSEGPYPFFTCAENHISSKSYSFDTEAILVAGNANVGLAKYYNGKFEAYQRTYVLTDFANIDVPYLFTILSNSLRPALLAQVQTSAMSYIRLPMLQAYELTVPKSFTEQQKIADCLGSLEDLIAAEGRKLEVLQQHKQGLMQQLFPQPGETVPRLRFPEFQDAPDWKTGRCRDIAKVLPGYGFPDKFQGNKKGQYPFYKVSDISLTIEKGQRYISEANNCIDPDVLDKIRGKSVPAGTIIFAKIGEAIRSNRRVITTKPAVIDNNTAGVKAMKVKISDEFLFYLWSNVSLIDHAGGVVPAVSKSALENVPLCYPSDPEEQQRIADCLSALDTRIGAQLGKLDTLRTHKQGLMQRLFPSLEGH